MNDSSLLLKEGYRIARFITKKHAKTFYFSSLFLSKEKRFASYTVYAVCRFSDDSVDRQDTDNRQDLVNMSHKIDTAFSSKGISDPLLLAFRETIQKYKIPKVYFEELLQGMQTDLEKDRYLNFADLYQYCYMVAGVVGLIMLHIFGFKQPQTTEYAINLGVAMQLTNILRDIKEDYAIGRVYLPQEEFKKFHLNELIIAQQQLDKSFVRFLKFQIRRARQYYHDAMKGIDFIKDRRSRFVVCLMKEMYGAILTKIEKNKYDVFSKRIYVTLSGKCWILLKVFLQGKYV